MKSLAAGALLAGVYWPVAAIGLQWAAIGGAGSPVWPAAGVALAGLLLGGVRLWPAVVVGRLAASAAVGSAQPLWVELLIAGGNALGAVLPALVLRHRARLDPRLNGLRDVLWLAAGAASGAAVAAAIGTGAVWFAAGLGPARAAAVGANWGFGNLVGTLTVAPFVLAWSPREAVTRRSAPGRRAAIPALAWGHLAALLAATALVSCAVFLAPSPLAPYLHTWHVFPVLIWAALAFQVRGAAAALLIVSALATWGATVGVGPFVHPDDTMAGRFFLAQQFAALASLTTLILAAVADERRGKEALKRAEEGLRALNAELERRVAEETAKLVQLQKMEGIGQLTGGIAHDFNNLLAVVLGNLELLKKRLPPGDERAARLLDNTVHGARRGAALTQRMLAFARKQELRPEPVGVPGLVFGMTDLLSRSIGPRIRIETRFAAGVPKAMVDANQLEMAVLNLAVNARDAMPGAPFGATSGAPFGATSGEARDAMPDGGTLTIEVDEAGAEAGDDLPPGSYVRLRVTDTGAGMDAGTLARATEPFFTTKGVGKGTGLGLPMVHGLAHQSGGRLRLRSEAGRGTTAEILLPTAAAPAIPAPVLATAPDAAPHGRGGVPPARSPSMRRADLAAGGEGDGGRSVLLVDDDTLVRDGTADMLEDLGYSVVQAASAQQALDILRGGRVVDAVVTDQAMPGMSGVQLAAVIEAERPGLPVVLASGYAELPDGALGAVAERLTKPFQQGQLDAALARAMGATRVKGAVPPQGREQGRAQARA